MWTKTLLSATIADASVDKYVIPIPWFYPEDSENETAEYVRQ
ncbi:MAG: hypothetical protein ACLVB8_20930 [Bacteroides thetaiotaomicron]